MFKIVVPSYKRSHIRLTTLDQIPQEYMKDTVLVVHPDEYKDYLENVSVKESGVEVIKTKHQGNLPNLRHYISTAWAKRNGIRYIFHFDDDLRFYYRPSMKQPQLKKTTPAVFKQMMNRVLALLEKEKCFGVGISARQGNNRVDYPIEVNSRMMTCYAIDTSIYRKEKIRYDKFDTMEDFYTTLCLLTRGYHNYVLYKYAWNQTGSNAAGGCSEYRTEKVQTETSFAIAELFPEFATVVKRKAKMWGELSERYDLRIQWKKAYQSSQEKAE